MVIEATVTATAAGRPRAARQKPKAASAIRASRYSLRKSGPEVPGWMVTRPCVQPSTSSAGRLSAMAHARAALVRDATDAGTLVRVWKEEMRDGLCYRAISAPRDKPALEPFLKWLDEEFLSDSYH